MTEPATQCPKCGAFSGDDWTQCGGVCPMPGSPHYVDVSIYPEPIRITVTPATPEERAVRMSPRITVELPLLTDDEIAELVAKSPGLYVQQFGRALRPVPPLFAIGRWTIGTARRSPD